MSSLDQNGGLDRQVAQLTAWAADAGGQVEAGAGSGMYGSRTRTRRLLADPKVSAVVAGHRDRRGRMNTELAGSALAADGRRLAVVDDGEADGDLVREMVEVFTSFCARLYGRRSAQNRAWKAAGCAERDVGPQAVVGARRHDVHATGEAGA